MIMIIIIIIITITSGSTKEGGVTARTRHLFCCKGSDKIHPRTGHEGPEGK
jgi:hypothetical protein